MRPSRIRKVATAILLADAVALGAAAVQVDGVVARTTTTPAAAAAAVPAFDVPITPAPPVAPVLGSVAAGVPLAGTTAGLGGGTVAEPGKGKGHHTRGAGSPSHDPEQSALPALSADDPGATVQAGRGVPPCPVPLAKAPQTGGLQSLVPFAPAFGPYAAEGFALASAYQPELQLLGPILATYPQIQPAVGPVLGPVVSTLGTLLQLGYDATKPLYEPYRTQFLEAETKLAAALTPFSQSLADNPLGGCIVELEGALTSAVTAASTSGSSSAPALPLLSSLNLGGLG